MNIFDKIKIGLEEAISYEKGLNELKPEYIKYIDEAKSQIDKSKAGGFNDEH